MESGLLVDFPYLLPNLFCAGIALIALLGVIFGFKETLPVPDTKKIKVKTIARDSLSFMRSSSVKGVFVMYSLQVFCNTGFVETYSLGCLGGLIRFILIALLHLQIVSER